jgi:phosphoribosyl 1,2-cyclic phosphate phosphodiesterase
VKLTFLGTGTSFGVPVVGCDCDVCTSDDPRDRRTRHGALLSWDDGRCVLVDTPPELRLQLVREGISRIDSVWFTHIHADHVHGIDDLRAFTARSGGNLEVLASAGVQRELEVRFRYIFDPSVIPEKGTSKPQLVFRRIEPYVPCQLAGEIFTPLPVPHGGMTVLGFRLGTLGYVTDAKHLPPETFEALQGVDTLVLNALWFGRPHPTHFNVEEAVEVAERLGARRTFLTHLSHRVAHRELEDRLPPGVRPAWDGLTINLESA